VNIDLLKEKLAEIDAESLRDFYWIFTPVSRN
jgi:hypothetical protein